jgi:hypothetical protein
MDTTGAAQKDSAIPSNAGTTTIAGETAPSGESAIGLQWNGYIQAEDRVRTNQHYALSFQEYRLGLNAGVKVAGSAKCYSELWIRSLGFPDVTSVSDLSNSGKISPVRVDLREAYFDVYNLFTPGLDLRIGRQRIAWGTADKVNPTDNLNPADMEDIWDFGRHLGSDAVKLSYYKSVFSVEAVFIPFFRPAVLPDQEWINALMPSLPGLPPALQGLTQIVSQSDTVIMPEKKIQKMASGGLRTGFKLFDYDFSLSYAYILDGSPLLNKVSITPLTPSRMPPPIKTAARAELVFPRMHVIGFDLAGAIVNVGVWGEGAVFIPEKVAMTERVTIPQFLLDSTMTTVALDHKPYIKFVVGLDYTFPANIYVNAQYVHGFLSERGKDEIEDYILANLDWKLLNETLTLSPLGIGLEIKDYKNFSDNYAFIAQPQLKYNPIDNAEITIGARFIMGENSTHFGKVVNNDEIYIRGKYSF